jgi:hypothetical protein
VYYPTFRFSVFPAQSVVVPYVTRPAVIYSPAIQFNPASIGQAAGPGGRWSLTSHHEPRHQQRPCHEGRGVCLSSRVPRQGITVVPGPRAEGRGP